MTVKRSQAPTNHLKHGQIKTMLLLNPLTLVSDQDRISPYSVKKKCDKKKKEISIRDYWMIPYQIL